MLFRLTILLVLLFSIQFSTKAQDTLMMLSGKILIVKNVEIGLNSISYMTLKEGKKRKRVDPMDVFSVKYADKTERIIYEPDSLAMDDGEYTVEQMRMYVKGEQDAILYYKNNLNKIGAFAAGGASAFFGFYGIIGPAIYSTIVGSYSPNMEKQKVSNPALLQAEEYREGYQRKVRSKKTKNGIIAGFLGFAVGFATISLVTNN